MTLETLIAELQTLAQACPPQTPVRLADADSEVDLQIIEVQSHTGGVEIHLKG